FKSQEEYLQQQTTGLLVCPICSSNEVRKKPSPIYVNVRSNRQTSQPATTEQGASPASSATAKMDAKLMKHIREFIENNSENVGVRFAEEAKKIHYGEAEQRNIHGHASREEIAELKENGIDTVTLPSFLVEKEKLN
ncbi:MAG: DUF1178 family protein, partial [Gammaproteobacteria bacterium]|nr:DUF1178 family protein [Gammaproteobacteria bacterium]